jgi:predicted transcriptional regulator
MYDTKFECRYHRDDVFLETDNVTDDQKNFIRDILYKEDVLNIFLIDFNDDFDVFSNIITELYEKIKHYQPLKEIMSKMAASVISQDEQTGLSILYSYDYMYITHKCVSEYLDTGIITEYNLNLLKQICK